MLLPPINLYFYRFDFARGVWFLSPATLYEVRGRSGKVLLKFYVLEDGKRIAA